MVKESKIFIGLKKTCLGVLDRGDRDKGNKTGLKEGGGIKFETTVLHLRCSLLRLKYLPFFFQFRCQGVAQQFLTFLHGFYV